MECANAAVRSISDCVHAQREALHIDSTNSALSLENACKVQYGIDLVQNNVIKDLRMLLRNLTYIGAAPQSMQVATAAFLAEASVLSNGDDEDTPQEFLQMWWSIASNLAGICGVDSTQLKNAIQSVAMTRYGIAGGFEG